MVADKVLRRLLQCEMRLASLRVSHVILAIASLWRRRVSCLMDRPGAEPWCRRRSWRSHSGCRSACRRNRVLARDLSGAGVQHADAPARSSVARRVPVPGSPRLGSLRPYMHAELAYAHFFPGPAITQSGPGLAMNYLSASTTFTF